jgi:hypothetical protein
MRKQTLNYTLVLSLLLAGSVHCSSSDSADESGQQQEALRKVTPGQKAWASAVFGTYLGSAQSDRFKEVKIEVQKVSLIDNKGYKMQVAAPNKIIDMAKPVQGLGEKLGQGQIAAGNYTEIEIQLGQNNSVQLADGSNAKLKIAGQQIARAKLAPGWVLKANEPKDMIVGWDLNKAIRKAITAAGANKEYELVPPLRATEPGKVGTIGGKLTQAGTNNPIVGATVWAQQRDANGTPQIIGRAQSDEKGNYQIGQLPVDQNYQVVNKAMVQGKAYQNQVSPKIALTQAKPNATYDAALTEAQQTGSVQIKVSPNATQQEEDNCQILQGIDEEQTIVAESQAQNTQTGEQAVFEQVPASDYWAQCNRSTVEPSGAQTVKPSQKVATQVKQNQLTVTQVAF